MKPNIQYIQTNAELATVVETLLKKKEIFIDLEFDKNHFRYGFNLCLMQVFDGENCFLIDPLDGIEIELIFPVLENPDIALVCFAFNEDMRLLHHLGARPNNIVDLGVAMRLLDFETLSLNNSILAVLGEDYPIDTKGSQQKSNWFQRPLTEQQHKYAAEDVLHLPAVKKVLMQNLEEINREEWFAEEMEAFEKHDWSGGEKVAYLTKKDQKTMTLREWIRFEKLMDYREELGASLKRPTYKVWDKKIALLLAKTPAKVKEWKTLKGIHPKLRVDKVQQNVEALLALAEKEITEHKIAENQSSIPALTKEKRLKINQQRTRIQAAKERFFLPIKEELKKEIGENYSNFFLSNRKMTEFATGEQVLLPYQKKMIQNTANKLSLELPSFMMGK
ncbi:ribonuclease D [Brumimicrobium aurantiacum]|uniref:Ribonuclease D n=1 Tax=Brumimicrobium aurantiacum TaxID=1737063 RepID=A0A3E1F1M1_9FLAO|nr:ribonuclease D [Brumimicrobium aurantiacum]RFC55617.1 ribonuclease D [Brumimicrobium aurantiacum]